MYKVIIIDDEWFVREGLKKTIPWAEMGCELAGEAADSEEALGLIEVYRPDIVLSDIRMPGMDGLELLTVMRDRYPGVQTIFLTGFDDFSYAQRALKLGASDILLKPSSPVELRRAFDAVVGKITVLREQEVYIQSLETVQKNSLRLAAEQALLHFLTGQAGTEDLNLIYEQLDGRLEMFHAFRVLQIDLDPEGAASSYAAGWRSVSTVLEALYNGPLGLVQTDSGSWVLLLAESELPEWEARRQQVIRMPEAQGMRIVASGLHQGLDQIQAAYEEARLTRLYPSRQTVAEVVRYESIVGEAGIFSDWDETELLEAVRWGTEEQLRDTLQALYKAMLWQSRGQELGQRQTAARLVFGVYHLLAGHFAETGGVPELKTFLDHMGQNPLPDLMLEWLGSMAGEVQRRYRIARAAPKDELEAVLDHIHRHYREELTLYDYATQLHMSESKFSKLFKKRVGTSFVDYIIDLRIGLAKELLLEPDARVGEVAASVGYQDSRYFSQLFRKVTGETPSAFREKLQNLHNRDEN